MVTRRLREVERFPQAWGGLALARYQTFLVLLFPAMLHAPLALVLNATDPHATRALILQATRGMDVELGNIGDQDAESYYRGLPFHRVVARLAQKLSPSY